MLQTDTFCTYIKTALDLSSHHFLRIAAGTLRLPLDRHEALDVLATLHAPPGEGGHSRVSRLPLGHGWRELLQGLVRPHELEHGTAG